MHKGGGLWCQVAGLYAVNGLRVPCCVSHAKVDVGRWRARATLFCDGLQMFTVDSTAVSVFERAKLSHQRIFRSIPINRVGDTETIYPVVITKFQ